VGEERFAKGERNSPVGYFERRTPAASAEGRAEGAPRFARL